MLPEFGNLVCSARSWNMCLAALVGRARPHYLLGAGLPPLSSGGGPAPVNPLGICSTSGSSRLVSEWELADGPVVAHSPVVVHGLVASQLNS